MERYKTFQIALPTDDDGFVGRACDAEGCKQYFKILVPDHGEELYCPYCGTQFHKDRLATSDQVNYALEAGKEEVLHQVMKDIQAHMKSAFRGSKGITYKPGRIRPKRTVAPKYQEREVDTEFQCPDCSVRFQVYGIFGFCPGCRSENLRIYDANWEKIKKDLSAATTDKQRQLRHAYSDLVSTFEVFCQGKAAHLTTETGNFQMLFDARKFFKTHANIDMLDGLEGPALLALRRIFQKRHVCIHAGGKATDRYIKMIPEDAALAGKDVPLSLQELELAATAMRTALSSLVKAIMRPGA